MKRLMTCEMCFSFTSLTGTSPMTGNMAFSACLARCIERIFPHDDKPSRFNCPITRFGE
jgi:hypothetical protein